MEEMRVAGVALFFVAPQMQMYPPEHGESQDLLWLEWPPAVDAPDL